MKDFRNLILFLPVFLGGACKGLFAQEQLGLRIDPYQGVNTLLINPAAGAAMPFSWDVNLGEAGVFAGTNYAFIRPATTGSLWGQREDLSMYYGPDITSEDQVPAGSLIFDYFPGERRRYLQGQYTVLGPSALVRLNESNLIGFTTRMRGSAGAQRIPAPTSFYPYSNIVNGDSLLVTPMKATAMAWGEIGLNYIRQINTGNGSAAFGITAKRLQGYEAAFFKNNRAFYATKLRGDSISAIGADIDYGWVGGTIDPSELDAQGSGWAFDLGVHLSDAAADDPASYNWRLGFSLIDIGSIRFQQEAELHHTSPDRRISLGIQDYEDLSFDTWDENIRQFSYQVWRDSTASRIGDRFSMWLPGALSLQGSYRLLPNIVADLTWVQRLPMPGYGVERSNILALTPRYEQRWWGASLPVVWYNYSRLRYGLSLRLGFVTIGTDHLPSWLYKSRWSGSDLYLAVKINPFSADGGSLGFKGGGKNDRCYQF